MTYVLMLEAYLKQMKGKKRDEMTIVKKEVGLFFFINNKNRSPHFHNDSGRDDACRFSKCKNKELYVGITFGWPFGGN